ncbi:NAD(P)/FAD-dependent oxidoreductase [Tanticharoenia sakaeratensis]|uniref:Amine oxidase n=1 Tax=Tanticharoenia sakaeratensis NBRC 103193 TaxID=1231623 RepID=A0A0D6MHJ6_9PROT|nr:FAD-dependent oxidoreductase [Tanticharoenia sakaeratensis]GAN53119.1 amine oxidase [Tanticharoenia sakaeratensis NBRC 103193]GBQ20549.1 amine oxidase [Tanticharoenia sakaeratensis NBRC 103193]
MNDNAGRMIAQAYHVYGGDGLLDAERRRIAVIGSGIGGLSCAWLLSKTHAVTVHEGAGRLGGHSNTVSVPDPDGPIPVDTGFIVYNEQTYPNLSALFAHLNVATKPADMSLSVSRGTGLSGLEYSGTGLAGLFAQKRNLLRPRFWSMLSQTLRFYRQSGHLTRATTDPSETLGTLLDRNGYGRTMQRDHLLPMAAAIWSCSPASVRDQPALAFLRFCTNHGLLQLRGRPQWRSVLGGSRVYVERLAEDIRAAPGSTIRCHAPVHAIERFADHVLVHGPDGARSYDDVVIATHAPDALALLADPLPQEQTILGALRYGPNTAILHEDPSMMPRHRAVWSSWNVKGGNSGQEAPCVTYWMNRLQHIPGERQFFVTLNPDTLPERIIARFSYEHPLFDTEALRAQNTLWDLQGQRRTWFCGAYFGAGFHEDGLQAGLAVAEALGGVRRPWQVADESGRIPTPRFVPIAARKAAA